MTTVVQAQGHGYTAKNCWPRVLGSIVFQLCAGECTPSVGRA